jgi:mRNA-degrading endonuclease YafQ of YafQ-DinJ toxin-antitoxin module
MIRFQIPSSFLPGFESLLTIDNQDIDDIGEFLQLMEVGTGPISFNNKFKDHFVSRAFYKDNFAGFLFSLGSFSIGDKKFSNTELVDGLASSFNDQREEKLDETQINKLNETLKRLLEKSTNLFASFKAFQLMSENDNVVRDARIITDIRLIFKDELGEGIRYGLVKHQLKLQSETSGDKVDYYFNLTKQDLEKLQEQIKRALEKEIFIRSDYKESISFINITE